MEIMEVFAPYTDSNQSIDLDDIFRFCKSDRGYYSGEYITQGEVDIQGRCGLINM